MSDMGDTTALNGLRVALLEARRSSELADLVRRNGGEPHSVPAMRETPREPLDDVAAALDRFGSVPRPVAIFATGVGVEALFAMAEKLGRKADLEAILRRAINVCRGPKPVAALKGFGMPVSVRAASPHTTRELLDAIESLDATEPLPLEAALVVHHGERSDVLVDAVKAKSPVVVELLLYAWELPEDTAPLAALVGEIIAGQIGAVAFTTQVQARHLFAIADEIGKREALVKALNELSVVVAVGPTCAETLRSLGTPPRVVPESPKMGPMVQGLARYLDER
ncbi:uroporphyrinogen-III synthase [Pendulispora rubella]